jgi:hypothetical protein
MVSLMPVKRNGRRMHGRIPSAAGVRGSVAAGMDTHARALGMPKSLGA